MTKKQYDYPQEGVAMTCRSYQEYKDMFVLSEELLSSGRILDAAGGASSFTAEAVRRDLQCTAADPMYSLTLEEMGNRGKREIEESTKKIAQMKEFFLWSYYGDINKHCAGRHKSLQLMLEDYAKEDSRSRYINASLPSLPFEDSSFRLILCSHFLFLYEQQFNADFHLNALQELIRICQKGGEIRIYPLVNLQREPYSSLQKLLEQLQHWSTTVEQIHTNFSFLPGASTVLRILKH
jgi:SAM-dependent methyltransferase